MRSRTGLPGVVGCIVVFLCLVPAIPAARGEGGRQVRIHLGRPAAATAEAARPVKERPNVHAVTITRQAHVKGSPPRRRSRALSWQELVVVALDEKGRETDRAVVPDPRLIRYETTDGSGRFVDSAILYRDEADLTVVLGERPGSRPVRVRVFQPRWTGREYVLDLLGETALP